MYMDVFGWSTQSPAAAPSDDDDALLAAVLGASFELQCSEGGGDTVSSDVGYGLDLPPSSTTQHGLSLLSFQDGVAPLLPSGGGASSTAFVDDSVGLLPEVAGAGAHDDGVLLNRFWFPEVAAEEPAGAAVSNTAAFSSGYSSTTGGGNISSGESNTYGCGGHDVAEVASASACAVSQPVPPLPPSHAAPSPSKRKLLDRYPGAAVGTSSLTTTTAAAERRSTKRAVVGTTATSITFGRALGRGYEPDTEAIAQVKEMIYRAAAMRPVSLGNSAGAAEPRPPEKPQRRKNVRISSDPQTVAARLRRERVSERLRALQRLVPGGSKMDTASMLDEAASYLKFLKSQLEALETLGNGGTGNYTARNPSSSVLAFGSDHGLSGYVSKSNRNMQF